MMVLAVFLAGKNVLYVLGTTARAAFGDHARFVFLNAPCVVLLQKGRFII